ncbi:MAG: ribonuclease P protein component [Roseiflexaceae bacterium]|nr:ribonuclease P protein component [Roseiflexaceae bacterium]
MKRAHRLRKPAQFQRARREGKKWETPFFALQALVNRRRTTRCGFVTSKRLGIAVVRNRAKRRLREVVRLVYDQIAPGWDIVFIVRSPSVADVDFQQLTTTVVQSLQRAGVWRELPTNR